ncbi:uncharacterized protein Dana_GF22426 [Drosophila ananassae]|uniref:Uncharacterized protein n=1 Tax=Drosophila ananassae TaxID=7217 RepID=B3MWM5_DROAN|nr:uncharacterized protein Dana_GF22426 [Drosophila ananassae]
MVSRVVKNKEQPEDIKGINTRSKTAILQSPSKRLKEHKKLVVRMKVMAKQGQMDNTIMVKVEKNTSIQSLKML